MPDRASVKLPPPVDLREMLLALHDVLKRAELFTQHAIKRDALSVRQRMGELLTRLGDGAFHRFESLFDRAEGKLGVVVTFLALLELAKEQLLDIVQEGPLAPIYVKSLARSATPIYVQNRSRSATTPDALQLTSEFDDEPAADTTNPTHEPMDQTLITRIVEAALLAANQPLTLAQLHGAVPAGRARARRQRRTGAGNPARADAPTAASNWSNSPPASASRSRPTCTPWVARLWTERQTKYTRATLETLALIAYRQPITRGEIEQVRGVAVNSNIIKALEEREWIRVVGHRDVPGKPALFGTTKAFLDYFGLKRLDELPPLSELKDIGELEPQFQFDGNDAAGAMPIGDIASDADRRRPADGSRRRRHAANDDDRRRRRRRTPPRRTARRTERHRAIAEDDDAPEQRHRRSNTMTDKNAASCP